MNTIYQRLNIQKNLYFQPHYSIDFGSIYELEQLFEHVKILPVPLLILNRIRILEIEFQEKLDIIA